MGRTPSIFLLENNIYLKPGEHNNNIRRTHNISFWLNYNLFLKCKYIKKEMLDILLMFSWL
jgi:hypothetical protein